MARESIVATGNKFIETVCPALGIEATLVKRVILDAKFGDIVNVYVEMLGSTKMLNIDFDLTDAKVSIIG